MRYHAFVDEGVSAILFIYLTDVYQGVIMPISGGYHAFVDEGVGALLEEVALVALPHLAEVMRPMQRF